MRPLDRFVLALAQCIAAALFLGITWHAADPAHAWFAALVLCSGLVLVFDALNEMGGVWATGHGAERGEMG